MTFRGFLWRLCASILSGAMLWLAFPDWGIWPLSVVALAIMLSVVDSIRPGSAAFYSAIFGVVFWLPHLQWSQVSTGGAWLPWFALTTTQVLAFMLWGFTASWVTRIAFVRTFIGYAIAMPLVWVGVEQLRSRVPFSGFPWGNLSYAHVDAPVVHTAPLAGETLVSLLVVLTASLLRLSLNRSRITMRNEHWWGRIVCFLLALLVYLTPLFLPLSAAQEAGSLRIAAVQGFIEHPGVHTYSIEGHVTQNHARVTQEGLKTATAVDLIAWGEGSLDRDPRSSQVVGTLTQDVVTAAGVPVLLGFNEYVPRNNTIHNLYGVWDQNGLSEHLYGKQIPVPFGEYIPYRSFISALATEAAQVRVDMEGMENSSRYDVTLTDGRVIPLGVGICFEVAYEALWAQAIQSGAQMLIAPSNNYHFQTTPEPAQQAQMARFRAIEYARSMVLPSTTGESMLIRPDGGILAATTRYAPGFIAGELPLRTSFTPASYIAPIASQAVIIMWVALVVGGIAGRHDDPLQSVSRRRTGSRRS